jgi:H+-transporting ATPase
MIETSGMANEQRGLSSGEARARLLKYGLNAVSEEEPHLIGALLGKFWAPVPWMLEATIVLELVLGKPLEASVIGALLVFNAALSLVQENRARNALDLLQKRLAVRARVLRDGLWALIGAESLVPGDFVHLQIGDLVPADIRIDQGEILVDQSMLTGESVPIEANGGKVAYAGSMVKRGEASGEVSATGPRTFFGKTAELVRTARTASHLETIIFAIVKYMVAMDTALAIVVFVYAATVGLPLTDTLPFVLILLVASVPVALPATFTLATALGAVELARSGVLVTRLSAIEEAAAMDTLCSDKTGTITENQLSVADVLPFPPAGENELLRFAAYASDEAGSDPIDVAVLSRARAAGVDVSSSQRVEFIPFEPATKLAEAVFVENGKRLRAVKGAPQNVITKAARPFDVARDAERLASAGCRVLAVAGGVEGDLQMIGLLALQDPPRVDSKAVIAGLNNRGVRVAMVTGDTLATAQAVAAQVGIHGRACAPEDLRGQIDANLDCAVFAGVFPEDKFRLVRALQQSGHVVGMTGDGVNDAPALKQAEVGIAVASASDVAKASASLVLTNPGLSNALAAVESSRRIYQRMLTYTLNKIIKTVEIGIFLSLGVILTGTFIITPLLIILLLFTNDFVTMSIATDRVSASPKPDRWHVGTLMVAGISLGSLVLLLSFGLFFYGREVIGLPLAQLQTLVFVTLVFTGQGMVYLVRERRHFWHSMPSAWMVIASIVDVLVVCILSVWGILMAPLPASVLLVVGLASVLYLIAMDFLKVPILHRLMQDP